MSLFRQLRALILPISAIVLIPGGIAYVTQTAGWLEMHHPLRFAQYASAIVLGIVGLTLLFVTIRLFSRIGEGTLAPWDPTQRLVVQGPYCYTRNPMISGVFFVILAEAIATGSPALFCWAVAFWLLNTVYFVYSEEPGLERRFKESFRQYKANVPRWIPRWRPWHSPND